MIQQCILVGAGGFLGAVSRFLTAQLTYAWIKQPWIPYATMTANILGCLLIGLLAGWMEARPGLAPGWRLFLMVGVLGGYTTFSSFGLETLELLRLGQTGGALTYVGVQLIVGLAAVAAGFYLAESLAAPPA